MCHHHHSTSNQPPAHLTTQDKLSPHDNNRNDEIVQFDEPDLLFSELQAFAEAEDNGDASMAEDDATASVTDSCSQSTDDDDDGSFLSSEDDQEDSLLSREDEGSCCTYYDDEQDLACLAAGNDNDGNRQRGVRFSTVEIREYACILGDHPCVRDSCPISLDWRYARGHKRDVDSFENGRFFKRNSYPRKLLLDERRRRIRETSRLSRRALREMELDVAMQRLEVSKERMSDFWGDIDEQQQTCPDPEGFWGDGARVAAIEE